MPTDCISYQNSGYFTPLINDYLDQKPELQLLYNRFPKIEHFEPQLVEKSKNFDHSLRGNLVEVLKEQYKLAEVSALTNQNIEALIDNKTFTITTGHQLNLFTGPLYFLYKIISTINLTKELKNAYPAYNFVPVYWMATEDHDFEEINHFNFKGKKFRWNKESSGPVGRLSTDGLQEVFDYFSKELGSSTNASYLKNLFSESYLKHKNLADATRYLANALFGANGLVILDADDVRLKKAFVPYVAEELLQQTAFKNVQKTAENLKKYTIQVNPRPINLFYMEDHFRARIVFEDNRYKVLQTEIQFSESEMLIELEKYPEKFSPNVIMRPLYQEVILPNLCYIGGGGEIAYWLELKSYFDAVNVTFPIVLLRNSVLIATEKQVKKAEQLNLNWSDLFMKTSELINTQVRLLSEIPIDFSDQKSFLQKQFADLYALADKTDRSFSGAVKAQEAKQLRGLDQLEKRFLKAQKRKHTEILQRITHLQSELFPEQSLQERQSNFSQFYLENGPELIRKLINDLKPLQNNFEICTF